MAVASASPFGDILDAAVERLGADAGSIQVIDPERRGLRLVVSRGIHPVSAAFWEFVPANSSTSCGAALAVGERMVMPDVEATAALSGSDNLREYRRSRLRAVQSTPVPGHDGGVFAVLSTHWRQPHTPQSDELRTVDELVCELVQAVAPEASGAPSLQADGTETLSRQYATGIINRRIAAAVGTLDDAFREITGVRGSATFLCACGRETCGDTLTVSLAVYDRVRQSPHRFLTRTGHAVPGIDQIVERGEGFDIVEIRPEYRHPDPPTAGGAAR
jgi:hypothetical protein